RVKTNHPHNKESFATANPCDVGDKHHYTDTVQMYTRFFNWNVTYGDIYPLGVRQKGILINGQFPGPDILCVTNDNLIINVFNSLDEPFLLSWNGVQERRNSYEDGVWGTTCPIPPGKNFTYILQAKDQIGSFYYFPSLAFHKAAGGFGGIRILSRPLIPVPFPDPSGDYTLLIGDWYKNNHTDLKAILDGGRKLPFPDGILINGRGPSGYYLTVEQGKTYRLRISNVGLQNSLNFRIQNHKMTLVEVEGTHTLQTTFSSLDVHVGQSYSVLFTADQPGQDYYIVASSRFTSQVLTTTGILHYSNSAGPVSGPPPGGPTIQIAWSLNQARAIRTNLTASGPRPNPQGSYHYGLINTTRTIRLASSAGQINGKQRYAINSVSFIPADTPLKLADYFQISGVYRVGSISDAPNGGGMFLDTSVLGTDYRAFIEIVLDNYEDIVQSYHFDGYSFFVVGMDGGQWTQASRNSYNLHDAIARCTVQVYPQSWTAIWVALDNAGMWNFRSEFWARQYLGQQFYMRVYTPSTSLRDEYPIPKNALLCGRASGRHTRPLGHSLINEYYMPDFRKILRVRIIFKFLKKLYVLKCFLNLCSAELTRYQTKVTIIIYDISVHSKENTLIRNLITEISGDTSEFDPALILSHKFPQSKYTYTERDAAVYALGVGACARDAVDADELKYVYHEDGQQFIQVLPTFASLFSLGNLLSGLPGLQFDPRLLLHGQQYIELYKPFPSSASLRNEVSLAGLHDKGKAAILEIETKSYEVESGELLCMNRTTVFLRGAGGFSKSSPPFSYSSYPTNQVPAVKIPTSLPFAVFEDALLYRLSGDYNPLHSDPTVAKIAGFSQPILHGLCTLGFAVRAVIKCICRGDPNMVKSISGRFLLHVYPGETLTTEMWLEGFRVIYQVKVKERNRTVLSGFVDLHGITSSL
ncbi:Cu-oxidase domain-containing protein/MaoC_dehydratas domain-containing protein/Cu-oxidase_2 domain-containing protein/Cu-oxidase_3 domain-containing protein/zf-MaoC domain-containing protein, partial [Cephalotus follicularis]